MIVNGESVPEAVLSAAVATGEAVAAVELAGEASSVPVDATDAALEDATEEAVSEAISFEGDKGINATGDTHATSGKSACSRESFVANNECAEGGETDGDELAGLGDATEKATSEAVLTTSVEVNGEPVGVTLDGSVALVDGHPVVATPEGSSVVIDGEEVPVTFEGDEVIVNGEHVGVSETVAGSAAESVVEAPSVDMNGEAVPVIFD